MTELEITAIIIFLVVIGALFTREVHERKRNGDPPIFKWKRR